MSVALIGTYRFTAIPVNVAVAVFFFSFSTETEKKNSKTYMEPEKIISGQISL